MTEAEKMVKTQIADRGILSGRVIGAMLRVPRHEFVPSGQRSLAYADQPLPIGSGQTISQPYIVAYMTEQLDIRKGDKVLEVGTGCGYQTAVLAELGADVFSLEIIPGLLEGAESRLRRLGYTGIRFGLSDGHAGWPEKAPFDRIIVTAAAESLPPLLVDQLKNDGRMVLPIGPAGDIQDLFLVRKTSTLAEKIFLCSVRFVPLVRPIR